jgi:hypothetical protein
MPLWYVQLQHDAALLFTSVLLILVVFLIARVGRASQPTALVLALMPVALVLALDKAILPAVL